MPWGLSRRAAWGDSQCGSGPWTTVLAALPRGRGCRLPKGGEGALVPWPVTPCPGLTRGGALLAPGTEGAACGPGPWLTRVSGTGGGRAGHQRAVSEVPPQARRAHELPVLHAAGRGKSGWPGCWLPGGRAWIHLLAGWLPFRLLVRRQCKHAPVTVVTVVTDDVPPWP